MHQALVNFLILLETKKTHFFKFLYKCYLKIYPSTVKPVYNGHPWDLKKVAVWKRGLIKVRFWLAVDESNRPLLTGGRCSELVVQASLTVQNIVFLTSLTCFQTWVFSLLRLLLGPARLCDIPQHFRGFPVPAADLQLVIYVRLLQQSLQLDAGWG